MKRRTIFGVLVLAVVLGSFSLSSQSPQVSAQLWRAQIQNLAACPVVLLNAVVSGDSQGFGPTETLVRNDSNADVKLVAMKYVYRMGDGTRRAIYVFWPSQPGQFPPGEKLFSKPVRATVESQPAVPVVDTLAQVFYVELHDGRHWGEDIGGIVAGARAKWWLVQAEKRRLLTLYQEKGEGAVTAALLQPTTADEHPAVPAARQALFRAYQVQGLQGVLSLLRKPEEASGPMVIVRLRE